MPTVSNTSIPAADAEATAAPTTAPTSDPISDFYSAEENLANGKTWTSKDYTLALYDESGKVTCIAAGAEIEQFKTGVFTLPAQGEYLQFSFGPNQFKRVSPNNWATDANSETTGIQISTTLEIAENKITETTTVTTSLETNTCVNVWVPVSE